MSARSVLTIDSHAFPLAPLRLGHLKAVQGDLRLLLGVKATDDIATMMDGGRIDAMRNMVFASAQAADTTVTREAFDAAADQLPLLDGVRVIAEAFADVMRISNLVGEASSSGEGSGPATEAVSISSGSTDSSSPPPASPTATSTT